MKVFVFTFLMMFNLVVFAENLFEGSVSEPVVITKTGIELKLSAVDGYYNCSDVKVVVHCADIDNVAIRFAQIAHDLNKKIKVEFKPNSDGSKTADCSIQGSEFSYNIDTGQFYIGQQ